MRQSRRAGRWVGSPGSSTIPPLNHPADIAVSRDGSWLYVVDAGNMRVVRMTTEGALLGTWGTFGEGAGQFRDPIDVEVDDTGRVFVVDGLNRSVQVFTPAGAFLHVVTGAQLREGHFGRPMAATPLGRDAVLVADFGFDRIVALRLDGKPLGQFGRFSDHPGGLHYPNDLLLVKGVLHATETDTSAVKAFDVSRWIAKLGLTR